MTTAQDDIDWLTRSENRIQVLELLVERLYDRSELLEAVDVSRVMFNRMLEALDERGWIAQTEDREYRATPLGRLVIEDVLTTFESAATSRKLRDIIQYIPAEEFDFSLRRLNEARITHPTKSEPIAPIRREVQLFKSSTERWRLLTITANQLSTEQAEEVAQITSDCEAIYMPGVTATVRDNPEMSADAYAYIQAGGAIYQYDGEEFPARLSINDSVVGLALSDDRGFVQAYIESNDETVLSWAEETFKRYKRESEPLSAEDFGAQF